MAFSGLQITRLGLAGIARSLYGSFAGKALKPVGPDSIFSVEGPINADALNLFSFIDSSAQSVIGQIFDKHSVTGKIDDSSINVNGPIDSSGQSVTGKL